MDWKLRIMGKQKAKLSLGRHSILSSN